MTKADIVNEISKNTGIEKVTVQKTVEAFMESIKDSLSDNKNFYLRGFGSFVV
jgi:DNA-binding protein HU-beta